MDPVNNAVYADWVDEVLLTGGGGSDVRAIPRTMRLEYARAVDAGATVTIDAWRDETGWSCRVHDGAEGTSFGPASSRPPSARRDDHATAHVLGVQGAHVVELADRIEGAGHALPGRHGQRRRPVGEGDVVREVVMVRPRHGRVLRDRDRAGTNMYDLGRSTWLVATGLAWLAVRIRPHMR